MLNLKFINVLFIKRKCTIQPSENQMTSYDKFDLTNYNTCLSKQKWIGLETQVNLYAFVDAMVICSILFTKNESYTQGFFNYWV